jgi:hypothetical protein
VAIYRNTAAGGLWTATTAWEEETAPGVWTPSIKAPGVGDTVNLVKAGGKIEVATGTVAEAKSIEANAAGNAFENTLKLSGSAILKVAGSVILSVTTTLTTGATVILEIINTAGTAEVNLQGKEVNELQQNGAGGTVKLAAALVVGGVVRVKAGTFDTGNQNITASKMEVLTGAIAKLGSSTIKVSGIGEAWACVEAATLEAGTSTIELTNAAETLKKFRTGAKTYATIVIASDNVEFITQFTVENLTLNTRGKSVKGTKIEKGRAITITGTLSTNATKAEKIKLESTLATKAFSFKKAAGTVTVTGVELKDCTGEGGATFIDQDGSTSAATPTGPSRPPPKSRSTPPPRKAPRRDSG